LSTPPPVDRCIIVLFAASPNVTSSSADVARRTFNSTQVGHPGVNDPPLHTSFVCRANEPSTAGPRNHGLDYQHCFGIIPDALSEITTLSAQVSQPWSKFVGNGILTGSTPEYFRYELETLHRTTHLGKTPRCVSTSEIGPSKNASFVLTLVGPT
jgi:hypothetical protein